MNTQVIRNQTKDFSRYKLNAYLSKLKFQKYILYVVKIPSWDNENNCLLHNHLSYSYMTFWIIEQGNWKTLIYSIGSLTCEMRTLKTMKSRHVPYLLLKFWPGTNFCSLKNSFFNCARQNGNCNHYSRR